jgi:hypothetical protein
MITKLLMLSTGERMPSIVSLNTQQAMLFPNKEREEDEYLPGLLLYYYRELDDCMDLNEALLLCEVFTLLSFYRICP